MKRLIHLAALSLAFFGLASCSTSTRTCVCELDFDVSYKDFQKANERVRDKVLSDFPDLCKSQFTDVLERAYKEGGIISERELAMFLVYGMYVMYEKPKRLRKRMDWKPLFSAWRDFAHPNPLVIKGQFGTSTKILEPAQCNENVQIGRKKFKIYREYLKVFAPDEDSDESGCY